MALVIEGMGANIFMASRLHSLPRTGSDASTLSLVQLAALG